MNNQKILEEFDRKFHDLKDSSGGWRDFAQFRKFLIYALSTAQSEWTERVLGIIGEPETIGESDIAKAISAGINGERKRIRQALTDIPTK